VLVLSQAPAWQGVQELLGQGFLRTVCDGLSSSIALGALLALVLHGEPLGESILQVLQRRGVLLISAALVVVCLACDAHHLVFHTTLTLFVGACVASPERAKTLGLCHRWLLWIGRRSYGLYLTHFVAVGAVRALLGGSHPLLTFCFALPLALVLAWGVFEVIERRFLRLKPHGRPQRVAPKMRHQI
jgi:peptidoglycan/LPS O-acetylase OafA/YrhL